MSLKSYLKSDLDTFFNVEEFGQTVDFYIGSTSTSVDVQFFDQESDLGDSMFKKMVMRVGDLPNISKQGYFIINNEKFGVVDFRPDEENLILQILLQKAKK